MSIIAISGKMQSGKNTVASIIQYLIYQDKTENPSLSLNSFLNNTFIGDSYSGFIQKSFAQKLKEIVSILTGIPVEDLEKQEVKERVLGEEWWYYKDKLTGSIYSYIGFADSYLDAYYLIKPTVRQLLQEVGTDAMRNIIHPNTWINALFADYKPIRGHSHKIQYVNVIDNIAQIDLSDKSFIMCQKNNRDIGYKDCKLEGVTLKVYNTDKIGVRYIDNSLPNWIITDCRFKNELQAIKDRGGITIRVNRPGLIESNHLSEISLDSATFDFVIDNNGNIEELITKVKEILIKENIIK